MDWITLNETSQISNIKETSFNKDVIIFKHSTTCSISAMAKHRLEDDWDASLELPVYYVDVRNSRDVSNEIATSFEVHHESPQILLIRDGECIYDASHFDISVSELKESLTYHGIR